MHSRRAVHGSSRALRASRKWAQIEGSPLPLGGTWIEEEQAFNFAVCAEHAESVKLLLYSPTDLAKPVLTFQFDPIRNKSGRIWHCRVPLDQICDARYYGYSVSGQAVAGLNGFDPEKSSSRSLRETSVSSRRGLIASALCSQAPIMESAPLGVLPRQRAAFRLG